MKVLIVGGCGYIGGYLTDHLINNYYDVTVYDSLVYESRYLKDVNFVYGDIRDRDKLKKLLPEYDIVIWLAAIVGDGACQVTPQLTSEINEDSVKWLVDNYKGKIIFTSTCSVYGINQELIDEETEVNPLSIYAKTKYSAEQYIINNYDDYLIFRLGTLFGLGDGFSRVRLDLVANILALKAAQGEDLTIFGGEQWRPLLHVKDVSHSILHGIKNDLNGLYNLAYKNYIIKDIAEDIKKLLGGDININYVDMKFEDLRNYKVKTDKIKQTGWKPYLVLSNGILEIYNTIKDNRIVNTSDIIYSNAAYMREKMK